MIHSCPMMRDSWVDKIVFHTASGDLVAIARSGACGFGMSVSRDGRRVAPYLGDASHLLTALGLRH